MSTTLKVDFADLEPVNVKSSNVKAAEVKDEAGKAYIVIVIDPTKDLGLSSTGKMRGVANSGGFKELPGDLVGNIYVGKRA